jgi:hypothetical protein
MPEISRPPVWTFSCILAARTGAHVCARFQQVEVLTPPLSLSKEPYVTIRLHLSRGALPRAVLLALIVTLVPLPVTAADNGKAPPAKPSSLREAASTTPPRDLATPETSSGSEVQKIMRSSARRSDQASNPATQSGGFFKSTPGIIVLSTLAVGMGYALYSAQHDRVSSQGKK